MRLPTLLALLACLLAVAAGEFYRCEGNCRCEHGHDKIICPGTNLTGLPTIFGLNVTVRTTVLGLQRNRIARLRTGDIMRHYPRLVVLDLRDQAAPYVQLLGSRLPSSLTVYGKHHSFHIVAHVMHRIAPYLPPSTVISLSLTHARDSRFPGNYSYPPMPPLRPPALCPPSLDADDDEVRRRGRRPGKAACYFFGCSFFRFVSFHFTSHIQDEHNHTIC